MLLRRLSAPIGEVSGVWLNETTFEMTIVDDATGADPIETRLRDFSLAISAEGNIQRVNFTTQAAQVDFRESTTES